MEGITSDVEFGVMGWTQPITPSALHSDRQLDLRPAQPTAGEPDKVFGECGNVIAAISERRQLQRKNAQPVVEVPPKVPGLYLLAEIPTGPPEITRTLTLRVASSPIRSKLPFWSTRSSFDWSANGISPTSSRNRLPPSANWKRPRSQIAPVKAPLACPNNSLSDSCRWNRTAIDAHPACFEAGCRQLLAGTGFAGQHGRLGRPDHPELFQHASQRGALPDNFAERQPLSLPRAGNRAPFQAACSAR